MHLLLSHKGPLRFGFACSLIVMAALPGAAVAADETRLEPTAHQNVKRVYSPAPAASSTSQTQTTSAGMVVHLDEQGRPTQNPSRTRGTVEIPAINQSHEGLTTRTVKMPGGPEVQITDLQGRFQAYAVGTIGPDGKVSTGCIAPGDIAPHGKDAGASACQEKCCK